MLASPLAARGADVAAQLAAHGRVDAPCFQREPERLDGLVFASGKGTLFDLVDGDEVHVADEATQL